MIRQNNKWAAGAITVIYFPEQEILDRLLRALATQVACIVVIDNGALVLTCKS